MTQITSVAIIGAGQMGAGIAQVCAQMGIQTLLHDVDSVAIAKGLAGIEKRLERAVSKEKITATEKTEALGHLEAAPTLESLASVDLVIEAVVENQGIKEKLFKDLDNICKPDTKLASNTSSISITKLAAATNRPEQVLGLHFMNPVPVMKLVEVIRGIQTSEATYTAGLGLIELLGKTAVTAKHDYPGFIVNRILMPMINEAFFALMEGIATPEEIDTAMKLGTNQPMGPLELADFVGIDTCLAICRIFQSELGDDKYRPCPLMVKYVEAGWLGKKSSRGVYQYD